MTDEGIIDKNLNVEIDKRSDGSCELNQPCLTQRTIEGLNLSHVETKRRPTPVATPLLHKYLKGNTRVKEWGYRSIIGILTYLQGTSRPDISMAVHRCTRCLANPKICHERAITRIGRYLLDTECRGLICKYDALKGLEFFVHVDFVGG